MQVSKLRRSFACSIYSSWRMTYLRRLSPCLPAFRLPLQW
jgi:hypothetical protein